MDGLVIFSNPIMVSVLFIIVVLHVLSAIPRMISPQKKFQERKGGEQAFLWCLSLLNLLLHLVIVVWAFLKRAEPEELLLAMMISAAVAMVCIGRREKDEK